ncbi:MAG: NAD-dependent epimerase/dehydratase family protein [Candidatus Eisenbacteria bacterium]
MRALVTGGTGFVGSPLVSRLLQDSWQVSLITRDRRRVLQQGNDRLEVFDADVSDQGAISSIAQGCGRPDVVFHLAASLSYFDRKSVYRTNVIGTRNLLDLAVRTSAGKFIYASSIEAIGAVKRSEVPAPADSPTRPISPYGASKVAAEKLVAEAARRGLPAAILRIGSVYGPGHLNCITDIAEAILTRNRLLEFLPVYADRYIHPIYNRDVTEGLMAACRTDLPMATVVLGGEYATVGHIFEVCCQILGRPLAGRPKRKWDQAYLMLRREYHRRTNGMDLITYLMAPSGRRVHRAYSTDKTFQILDLADQVPLRTGIAETLAWVRNEKVFKLDR